MARFIYILILFLLSIVARAQNLVPNASFESHYDCSQPAYQLSPNAASWRMIESPDYFNSCVNGDSTLYLYFDVPKNTFGYQQPRLGNAYAGIATFLYYNYREYAQAQLLQNLDSGQFYCVSFNCSLSDSSTWAINKIGAYLSADTLNPPPYQPIPTFPGNIFTYYIPQVESTSMMSDRLNWHLVSGTFQAIGDEKYITIGNFRDDSQTDTLRVLTRQSTDVYSYYYLDDISVEKITPAMAGTDSYFLLGDSIQLGQNPTENAGYSWFPVTGLSDPNSPNPKASPTTSTTYVVTKTQCSSVTTDTVNLTLTSVGIENFQSATVSIYPNPANDIFQITLSEPSEYKLELFNAIGQLVWTESIKGISTELMCSNFEPGLFLLKVEDHNSKSVGYKKIIIYR